MFLHSSRNWLNLAMLLALAVILTLGTVTYLNTMEVRRSEIFVGNSYAVREATRAVFASAKDMETGQRGFLLTGDPTYLDPYHAATERAEEEVHHLQSLVEQMSEQRSRAERLGQRLQDLQSSLRTTIDSPKDQQGSNENIVEFSPQIAKTAMEDIRSIVGDILDHEAVTIADRERESRERLTRSQQFVVVGNGLAILLLIVSAFASHMHRIRRAEAERQMLEDRAELASVVNTAGDGIIAMNNDFTIRLINPAGAISLGQSIHDILNHSLLDYMPNRFHEHVLSEIKNFLQSDIQLRLLRDRIGLRADGTEFPFEGTLAKSAVGREHFLTLMFRDLSQSRAREAQIRQQSEILDNVRDTIILCNMDDHITLWNHGAELFYGVSSETAIGKTITQVVPKPTSTEDNFWQSGRSVMLEYGVFTMQLSQRDRNDHETLVEHRRSLIRDESGKPVAQLIIQFDVTDRVAEEERLRRSQRLESIGTLTGGIAHDLNNVLTPIIMSAQLITRKGADVSRLAKTITSASQRGSQMIRKLLAFAGGHEGVREVVELGDIVREAEEILRHTLPKSIELDVKMPDNLPPVQGNSTELSQVLMNLAINARDAMPDGGHLELRAEEMSINSAHAIIDGSLSPGNYVKITVQDSGTGIDKRVIDRIFDPFFTTKEQGHGTGLGLATSRGIVRSHGGDVHVSSAPGIGTSFIIYLPVFATNGIPHILTADEKHLSGNGEVILLIDDEPLILEAAQAVLGTAGYQVVIANSGIEAIAYFGEHSDEIDAAIIDMMMPQLDGESTALQLKQIKPELRVVASSGLRRPEINPKGLNLMDGFLPKPYSDEQLLHAVRKVFDEEQVTMNN